MAPWMDIANGELGTKESSGDEHNPRVLEYLSTCDNLGSWGRGRDETPWCAAFVNWCLEEAGVRSSRHALARSYVDFGCDAAGAPEGAIAVIKRKTSGSDTATGSRAGFHVGFVIRRSKTVIRLLGGNQRNEVNITSYPLSKYDVIAVRWPTRLTSEAA